MLKYLLDTNIAIYVIKHRPPEVREIFNRHHGRMAVSVITLAELVHGAEKSQFPERNLPSSRAFPACCWKIGSPAEPPLSDARSAPGHRRRTATTTRAQVSANAASASLRRAGVTPSASVATSA